MQGSLDNDGDSQMQSSNSTSPGDLSNDITLDTSKPSTPIAQTTFPHLAEMSPPNSQGVPLPTTVPGLSGANANGKRPLSTIDSNGEAIHTIPVLRGGGQSGSTHAEPAAVMTHPASGYSWSKPEDEPGYLWKNKRAVEDANRAWDSVVLKEKRIGSKCDTQSGHSCSEYSLTFLDRYGDPFEMADRELAMMTSQQQR